MGKKTEKEQDQKLEAEIIAKIEGKKKQNNVDEFLLLVNAVRSEASKEILSVYNNLMKDLKEVELLKQKQKRLTAGLLSKYGELLTKTDGFLIDLVLLQQEKDKKVDSPKEGVDS